MNRRVQAAIYKVAGKACLYIALLPAGSDKGLHPVKYGAGNLKTFCFQYAPCRLFSGLPFTIPFRPFNRPFK